MSDIPHLRGEAQPPTEYPAALEQKLPDVPPVLYAENEGNNSLLMDYIRTLIRHKGLIAGLAGAGVIASFLFNFAALPVYRSRTSLDIQSLNSDFLNIKMVAPTGGGSDPSQGDYLQTQIKLLQSDTLLERTIGRLESEPHPSFIERRDLASRIERALFLSRGKYLPFQSLIDDAAKHITVKPVGVTRLVEITCDSWDADFSAKFCNTLVDQFRIGDLETRQNESQKTSEWLTSQVKDVKLKAEESQRKLEEATGGNGLVLSQESTGVEEDRLRAMQGEYVKAQANRMEKEAEAGIGGEAPSLNESPAYRQYQQKLAELQGEVAKLVPPLTEANPTVIHLRSQIKATESDMAAERAANASRLKSDYEAALHREAMLAGAYHREEAAVSSDLGKASRVSLLRREVESEQQLYQTLLQLAREAGFASAIHASTVRVVDAAKPVQIPFSPKRGSSAGSGLLMGTICGVGLAFLMERTNTVFRVPGETERYLGLCELGVIPSSPRPRALAPIPIADSHGAELIPPRGTQSSSPLSSWGEDFSIVAEAYRNATTSLMLSENSREKSRVYVLSSPNAGEGKTTVTSNMGVALSKSRLRVLLIDGDLRKPALHKVMRVSNEFGLRNLLRGETRGTADSAEPVYQSTGLPNLFVLPSGQGSEEVVELLHSPYAGDLIKRLRSDFDVVIIDTPPMLHLADTRILASHAQGAILVVRAGGTSRDEALKARDLFAQDGVRMIGTILNDFNPLKNGLTDYYKSYYRYIENVTPSATGLSSWFDGLRDRERWMMQPKSDSGVIDGLTHPAAAEGTSSPGSTSGNARRKPDGSTQRGHPEAKTLDAFVNHFVDKMFKRSSEADNIVEFTPLEDGTQSIDPPAILDRRRSARHEGPQLFAHYWDGGPPQSHYVRDISDTGVYVLADERWYPGTQVMIQLQRPGATSEDAERSIKIKAKVVRFGTDGMGFEFVMPPQKAKASRIPEKFISARPDHAEYGAGHRELHRFLQKLPTHVD